MSLVVFLRAVNVGGRTLRPKAIADELGWINIGAAGTFVVPGTAKPAAAERAIRRELPFETEVMVCAEDEILRLVRGESFGARAGAPGVKRFASILARAPDVRPRLPIERPAGTAWEVCVVKIAGRFALILRRRRGHRAVYPKEVVERSLGIPATTRGWDTLLAIARIVERHFE